jgi:retron-type reverse transcriptase
MTDPFSRIVDFENLHTAYRDARVCKRYRSSILKFGYQLEENLLALRSELTCKTYRHGGYREFVVTDSKKRVIKAAPFRDRVVHHAVCNIIEPIFECGFIYDSYACRKGKGTHAAILRLEHFIRSLKNIASERERERERAARPASHRP